VNPVVLWFSYYRIATQFNCYDWDKMTLWCTSGGSKGRYVYCCGRYAGNIRSREISLLRFVLESWLLN
jgi:hypothetical protein